MATKTATHAPQRECEGCPFGGPKVGSKGNPKSTLIIVGESPGAQEVRLGAPFSGPSGVVLDTFLDTSSCYVVNAMECSPHKRDKDQHSVALAAQTCHKRLIEHVTRHPRRVILALGNAAVWSLTGDYSLKITQIRGKLIQSPYASIGIVPAIHPAALMRGTGSYRQFRQDLLYAAELDEGTLDPIEYKLPEYRTGNIFDVYHLLSKPGEYSCDIETSGFSHRNDRIIDIGITDKETEIVYCFRPSMLHHLKPLLESKEHKWCWHNGKFDVKFFRSKGIQARVDDDTMLMSYAMDETRGVHDLETVSGDVLHAPNYKYVIDQYLPKKGASYEHVPMPVLDKYMADDVARTQRIRNIYSRRVEEDPASCKLYHKTLIPGSELLTRIEQNGIYVDQDWLNERKVHYLGEDGGGGIIGELRQRINEICGRDVNPGSPQQMQEVLYKQFKLPKRGKGSTDKDTLKRFAENPRTRLPIVLALQDFRVAAKACGTYVTGLQKHIDPITGRVYATFLLHGTITGRLASRDPNLQNIPRDPMLRGMFCAAPGYEMLEVDLSQAELRSLAALSGDPVMVELYNAGGDIHTELAEFLFGPNWTKENRVRCKNVNFGIIYGITKWGLMEQIGDTADVAQDMIDGWAARFPVAWDFIQRCRRAPAKHQIITTCFGRKKRVGLVTNGNIRFLQNESANFPHQSVASDITLHAAIRVEPYLRSLGVRIVNLVHDSIITEIPKLGVSPGLRHHVAHVISRELEQVPIDWGIKKVPFKADAEIGERWGHNKEFDFAPLEAA